MSDWKWEILTEPSNGQESYSPPAEQGYLFAAAAPERKQTTERVIHIQMGQNCVGPDAGQGVRAQLLDFKHIAKSSVS